jgi:hypothetical protein
MQTMKKLTLNPEALRVESFDAGRAQPAAGTVQAFDGMIRTPVCPSHHNTECCATDVLITNCC